jgi:hypothetical protein
MAIATPTETRSDPSAPPAPPTKRRPPTLDIVAVGALAAVAVLLGLLTNSDQFGPIPTLALGALSGVVLFSLCGAALAFALVPTSWGPLVPLLSLPLGAAASGLVLSALGFARVPLHASLWLVLAAGLLAAAFVLRRRRAAGAPRPAARPWGQLASWVAVVFVLLFVALLPAWRTGQATVYGQNPDAHQVVGIAVLFQHVPPTATDVALPVDTVPRFWRFRYPIFYPLAAGSNLVHMDPIRLFPSMAALLIVIAAIGFGAFAVQCLRAPPRAGPVAAAAVGLSVITLHLAWHPYWNQLWGLAMMPYALLFGWSALETLDIRLGALCAIVVVMLGLAYPLALPDPLVILVALAIGYGRRPRLAALRSRSWVFALLAVLVLAPAVVGAAIKLYQGVSQLLNTHSDLWGGDVTRLMPVGRFVGTGGGIVPALIVAAVAALSLRALPRRVAAAVGVAILALCVVDIRFRVARSGAYMDFKQLSFVGATVIAMAAAAAASWVSDRRRALMAAGVVLSLAWGAAAVVQDRREVKEAMPQVTGDMFELRSWGDRLPRGASVRVDIAPSGYQLWAVYMLGSHPVDSPAPILHTTYAHAPYGVRADYSVSLHYYRTPANQIRRYPKPAFAVNPPVDAHGQFVLRRIVWPKRLANVPDTASQRLVEP